MINIIESPEIIMLSFDKTEGDGMVNYQSKDFAEEDTWSSGPETSNSSDPDVEPMRGRTSEEGHPSKSPIDSTWGHVVTL